MARRGRKPGFTHSELTRERIRTAMLVNRLQAFVLGDPDPQSKKPVEMSSTGMSAALGLLRKTLPDLQAIEHLGEVEHRHHVINAQPLTEDEWAEAYGCRRN